VAFPDERLAWRRQYPSGHLNFVASYYLDQRLGGWAASLMSGYDMAPGITIHPANNPKIIDAMITPDHRDQIGGRLQLDVIRALAPDLLRFPLNPKPLRRKMATLRWKVQFTARQFVKARLGTRS
jgi:hypothetical protein